jgi:hypothetical protein
LWNTVGSSLESDPLPWSVYEDGGRKKFSERELNVMRVERMRALLAKRQAEAEISIKRIGKILESFKSLDEEQE